MSIWASTQPLVEAHSTDWADAQALQTPDRVVDVAIGGPGIRLAIFDFAGEGLPNAILHRPQVLQLIANLHRAVSHLPDN